MPDLAKLATAIRDASPHNLRSLEILQQELCASAGNDVADPDHYERTLACILDSFRAAAYGKEVLDQVLLDVLPYVISMAHASNDCAQRVMDFCSMAVDCCSPRDTVTALLDAMDQLLHSSPSSAVLQLLCCLMALLPALLAKLSKRKAAFSQECLLPVANLAQADGQVLQDWLLAQLQLAAGGSTTDSAVKGDEPQIIMRRLDAFMAANWQQYASFIEEVLHNVLPSEADQAQQQSCRRAAGNLILQLLWRLTAAWPPPVLEPYVLQLLQSTKTVPASLPTSVSVLAPTAMLPVRRCKAVCRQNAEQHTQQQERQQGEADSTSDAADVVQSLLVLLQQCEPDDWHNMVLRSTGDAAAGAALALLYRASFLDWNDGPMSNGKLGGDTTAVEILRTACCAYSSLFEASQGNPVVLLKAVALLQHAAAEAALARESATPTGLSSDGQANYSSTSRFSDARSMANNNHMAPAAAAAQLLPQLATCISLLSSSIASGVLLLQAQAKLAMQQLLQAPGPAVSYCCMKSLLSGEDADQLIHPEVAALLMQEVRLQLAAAQQGSDSPYAGVGSAQLVMPWLQQHSAVGWQTPDGLADRANAICSALAVVRLTLLKLKSSSKSSGTECTELMMMLQQAASDLSAATLSALQDLQLINKVEQGQQHSSAAAFSAADQQRLHVPGEAQGQGLAVDAWLAVSRVQDVLDRVLELM